MFRRYFITGLLIWVPIAITLWVLDIIVTTMDLSLSLLPSTWQPVAVFGRHLPGIGAILTLMVIFVTGLLATNFLGQRLVKIWEGLLSRIPIVRTIYSSVKQVSDTLLSPQGNAFRKALLVEYPRKGSWTIGFQTGTPAEEVRRRVAQAASVLDPDAGTGAEMVSIYVDEALKYIVSMGVVSPNGKVRAGGARGPNTKMKAEIN